MEEEANVTADEDEHLTILACLLQLQADELKNDAPNHEGLNLGQRNTKLRQMMEVHAMLYDDYFATSQHVQVLQGYGGEFEPHYLRGPNEAETTRIMAEN
jgi:hypothetical protein